MRIELEQPNEETSSILQRLKNYEYNTQEAKKLERDIIEAIELAFARGRMTERNLWNNKLEKLLANMNIFNEVEYIKPSNNT